MALTNAALLQPQGLTTTERNLLALAGADTGRLIYNETTKGLEQWDGAAWVSVSSPDASETVKGIAQIATAAEVTAGTDDLKFVTPAKLAAGVPAATEAKAGKVELATAAETTTGTDATRAVHPAGLKVELDKKANLASPSLTGVPNAPTAAAGTSTTQLATTAFVHAATPAATEIAKGVVELATAAETTTGTDATRAVHPAGLKVELDKKVDLAGDTMTGNLTVPSLNGGQLAGFRNVLINGALAINQRGVTIAAAAVGKYGPDRWKKVDAGNMTQIVEAGSFEPGATYTLSGAVVTTQQLTAPATGDWTLPNIPIAATKIQLELGTVATPFERRPIGTELALCQRYYFRLQPGGSNRAYGPGFARTNTANYCVIPFPVVMRGAVSAVETTGTATDYGIDQDKGGVINCNAAPSFLRGGDLNATINFGIAAGTTTGAQAVVATSRTANSFLGFSAEL